MEHNDSRLRETPSFTARQDFLPGQTTYSEQTSTSQRDRQSAFPYDQSSFPPTSNTIPSVLSGGVQIQSFPYAYGQGGQLIGPNLQPEPSQQPAGYAAEDQRSQHNLQPYGHGMIFGVPSQASSQTRSTRYDSTQQYPQRSNTTLDVLSTSYAIPQQYYVGGNTRGSRRSDISPPSRVAGQLTSQYSPLQYSQSSHNIRSSNSTSSYSNVLDNEPQTVAHPIFESTQYAYQTQPAQTASDYDNTYDAYQTELKKTYGYIHDGQLREASGNLLMVSKWLLGNVEALGLVRDDESLHSQRLAFWEEFNNCWLALLQSQKEKTVEIIRVGQFQQFQSDESTISQDFLEEMGKELVNLCDGTERYGLVDYQLGVWEEQIITVLTQCLDLLDNYNQQAAAPPILS